MSPRNATEIGQRRAYDWDDLAKYEDAWARKVDTRGECWLWLGARKAGTYGFFHYAGRQGKAHRYAYERFVGPIPPGYQIDHLCRNPSCVRPDHLEAVTPRENLRRSRGFIAENIAKTTCPRGHAYSGVNNQGRRICHACAREWMRKHRAVRRAA